MKTKTVLKNLESMPDAVMIGSEKERDLYFPAITRMDKKNQVIYYDYERLAQCFADGYMKDESYHALVDKKGKYTMDDAMMDAYEWIAYNVERSLPYWGQHAPRLTNRFL